jgi:hypothetical protein
MNMGNRIWNIGRLKKVACAMMLCAVVLLTGIEAVKAETWEIPVSGLCCTKQYDVYGKEKPVKEGDSCFVRVEAYTEDRDEEYNEWREGFSKDDSRLLEEDAFDLPFGLWTLVFDKIPTVWAGTKSYLAFWMDRGVYHAFLAEEYQKVVSKVMSIKDADEYEAINASNPSCVASDVNTNCVAERLLCSYEKYQGVLYEVYNDQDVSSLAGQAHLQRQDIFGQFEALKREVVEDSYYARKALETSLAVYHQLVKTYRVHLVYKDFIVALVASRNWTTYMANLFTCWPNKLVGTATTRCN